MRAFVSKALSLIIAWTPLFAGVMTYVYIKYFRFVDFGRASIILDEYVVSVVVGGLFSILCILLSFFIRDPKINLLWYVRFGYWYQGVLILCMEVILLLGFANL